MTYNQKIEQLHDIIENYINGNIEKIDFNDIFSLFPACPPNEVNTGISSEFKNAIIEGKYAYINIHDNTILIVHGHTSYSVSPDEINVFGIDNSYFKLLLPENSMIILVNGTFIDLLKYIKEHSEGCYRYEQMYNETPEITGIFEHIDTSAFKPKDYINTQKLYNYIVESGKIAIEENVPMDDVISESILGSLVGAVTGATLGKTIMTSVCQILGIQEKGVLYDLLTSRVVLAALGGKLGYRL